MRFRFTPPIMGLGFCRFNSGVVHQTSHGRCRFAEIDLDTAGSNPVRSTIQKTWGRSSDGRASHSHCEGREFNSPWFHQIQASLVDGEV